MLVSEQTLLESHGHEVVIFSANNDGIRGVMQKLKVAWETPYSGTMRKTLTRFLREVKPDIVHVHNVFPLITTSVYDACRDCGVPVVQTLHNFRTICPGALFLRKEKVCEECLHGHAFRAGLYRCYRGSLFGSLAVGRMVEYHRKRGTWREKVDCFIALTDFARDKFVQAGFPSAKIAVKPNFLNSEPMTGKGEGGYALFVGRLSQEKGIKVLLAAWERLAGKIPLKIVGDGPLAPQVVRGVERIPAMEWLGQRSRTEVLSLMNNAMVLVFPSIWYEGFPMSIVEAFSVGLPVIAGDLGSMSSLIDHRRTGLHFRPGDSQDLAAQVEWALAHPAELARMSREARCEFEAKYTAEKNYQMMMNIYQNLIRK